MAKITIPEGLQKKELFEFLKANKSLLIAEKKLEVKHADACQVPNLYINNKGEITKSVPDFTDTGKIQVVSVINTTNLLDSHDDVHIPGIWDRSLKNTKQLYLTEEHDLSFRGVISQDVTGEARKMSWKSLGADYSGQTQALIFTSIVTRSRNEFMYDLYKAGQVPNHSVGMQYVNLLLAIKDEDYKEEYAAWNEYISQVANQQDAEDNGYFFAVLEAKVIEGAACIRGSNWVTPTLEVDAKSFNTVQSDPARATQAEHPFNVMEAIKNIKIIY